MMLEMKCILKSVVFVACACLVSVQAQSQTYQLQIDSIVGIPDTVYDGQEINFFMIISMTSPLFYQGDIFVELEYNGAFYPVDSAIVANATSSLSPNAPNTIQVMHRLSTDDDLNIGDNVVVVWPRIGDGVNPTQVVNNPETVIITLVEPNGVDENVRPTQRKMVYPNPAQTTIHFIDEFLLETNEITIHDAFGRIVKKTSSTSKIDVSDLPHGLYFVRAEMRNGRFFSDKLIISR
jgi:hypothetical protein